MKRHDQYQAGMFLLLAIIIFAVCVFTLGRERQIFATQEEYHTTFMDVKGLSNGAPVRLGGISIGRVSDIGFSNDLADTRVHVRMLINEEYLERLRSDSFVAIETQGLLGDRFLSVSTGSSLDQLLPGSGIPSREAGDIAEVLNKAGTVVDTVSQIANNVNESLGEFKKKGLGGLSDTLTHTAELLEKIEKGDGLVHRLIYSKKDGDAIMNDITSTLDSVKTVAKDMKEGPGLLHALIYDPKGQQTIEALTAAASNLAQSSEKISQLSQEVIDGEGLLHELVFAKAPEGLDEIMIKMSETAENLKVASEALARGSGTIGALLVDSQLYDNLVEVTDGAKRSMILRYAIKNALKRTEPREELPQETVP